jgi:hypothetical protein
MRNILKFLAVFAMISVLFTSAFAQKDRPVFRNDIRALGMGNAGIAMSKSGIVGMIYNPALLNRVKFDLIIPGVLIDISTGVLDATNFAVNNADKISNNQLDSQLLTDAAPFDRWTTIGFAPLAGLGFKNFAVMAYGNLPLRYRVDTGVYTPRAMLDVNTDAVLTGGLSYKIWRELVIGVSGKFITRFEPPILKLSASKAGETGTIVDSTLGALEAPKTGISLDLGAFYGTAGRFDFGFVIQDLIGFGGEEAFDFAPNVKFGLVFRLLPRLVLAADFVDLFNTTGTNFFNRTHMGAELDLTVLKFRGGFNQGYPTVGVAINLFIIRLDAAIYSKELGRRPGDIEDFHAAFELKFGI